MSDKKLGIYFGAMVEPLSKQLTKQGFKFDKDTVLHFQKDMDALVRVRIRGYILDSQIDKINKKLYKKIEQHIIKENKLVVKK